MSSSCWSPLLSASLLISMLPTSMGWWDTPHMITALIAQDHLTPNARARLDLVLATGAKDLSTSRGDGASYSNIAFAAVWPDDIKPFTRAYDMWHYIDTPWVDGLPDFEPPPLPVQNLGWTLSTSFTTLSRTDANPWSRAFALRMLLHAAGDAHNPLHAIERYTPELPGGDYGGNLFLIHDLQNPDVRNLHALYDSGAGLFTTTTYPARPSLADCQQEAKGLQARFPFESFFPPDVRDSTTFPLWLNESYALARNAVYPGITFNATIPVESPYRTMVQDMCAERIVLGGYRLAACLNSLFVDNTGPETEVAHDSSWTGREIGLLVTVVVLVLVLAGLVLVYRRKLRQTDSAAQPLIT